MYMEIVSQVVQSGVSSYAHTKGFAETEVLKDIKKHLNIMSSEYYSGNDPNINYQDPLCRLGYLHRYAPAHATLFEHVLRDSDEISLRKLYADRWVLNICAVGGGPGTELLGIAKYLVPRVQWMPRKIGFTVLDKVPHWSADWQHLADVIENYFYSSLEGSGMQPPTFAPSFLPFDVFNEEQYGSHAYHFHQADIVIFNYLFSENKTRLSDAYNVVNRLAELASPDCTFVVIDRQEKAGTFTSDVVELFRSVFGEKVKGVTYNGTLDPDEEKSNMGELLETLGPPHLQFEAFWLVAKVNG
ncbi:MAG: hypothetical protein OXD46_15665 [Chloroflexi bacterium]|nr:hypothetical protein [Chloroflexota bacterium]